MSDMLFDPGGRQPLGARPRSVFYARGMAATVAAAAAHVQDLYLEDSTPWVVGYSGGKDSTATTVLVWMALAALPEEKRHKPVHVISTDTKVENPVIASWVAHSLRKMEDASAARNLPFRTHQLTPALKDSFWVCLIGRGYAAPRPKFRWCTERLKIKPSNEFIRGVVSISGEAILILGTRKAESDVRARRMESIEKHRARDLLSPNMSLRGSWVYSPLEDWTTDDVWMYLMQQDNPWGIDHKELLGIYAGASADAECPVVVDTSTPTCGGSRFGCWTCTMVTRDKSMSAMVANDVDNEWMMPLLAFRDKLADRDDRPLRDFRRANGRLHLFHDDLVHGPYTQDARAMWLRELLKAQAIVQETGPAWASDLELVSTPELEEIRRIWVEDKNEVEDLLPGIYKEETGRPYPGTVLSSRRPLGPETFEVLAEVTGGRNEDYRLIRNLLAVEQKFHLQARRAGLFPELEKILHNHYGSKEEALETARAREAVLAAAGSPAQAPAESGAHEQGTLFDPETRLQPDPGILRGRPAAPRRPAPGSRAPRR